jgi:hypothetical protein
VILEHLIEGLVRAYTSPLRFVVYLGSSVARQGAHFRLLDIILLNELCLTSSFD